MAQLLRQHSGTAWAGQTGEHKHMLFLVCSDTAAVAEGSNRQAGGKNASTIVILTLLESQKGFDAL